MEAVVIKDGIDILAWFFSCMLVTILGIGVLDLFDWHGLAPSVFTLVSCLLITIAARRIAHRRKNG